MTFARKNVWLAGLILLTALCLMAFAVPALAAEDPIEFSIQIDPQSMTAPGNVQVSLRVANTSNQDMIDPVTLYDPDGNVVTDFGDGGSYILSAGSFRTWEGVWKVTQQQLNAGEFSYQVKYHIEDENGDLVELSKMAVARVEFTGERVTLEVNRTISPEVVRSGSTASVIYELYNSGNVKLTDIKVKEKISKNAQTIKELAPGEKKTLTFTSRIGNADLTSGADITYKSAGSTATQKQTIDDKSIPLAKPNLKITLSSPSTGVNIGEAARLVITFANEGNISYSNVTVKDEKKGDILTNLTIPANTTVTEEKEFILTEPTTFKISATLPDNTGNTNTLNAADSLTIGVFDPEKTLLLSLNLTCDQETIHQTPANVRFTLNVTNNSNVAAENITITHGSVNIGTIASLAPGASTLIVRDARISQAGRFCFTASVKDSMQNTVTFSSNTLQITYAPATPEPTKVPTVTIAPPELVTPAPADAILGQTRNIFGTVAIVLGVLFGLGAILFVASTVVRLVKKGKSKAAFDHLELAERRDYTEPPQEDEDDSDLSAEENYREDPLDLQPLPHVRLMNSDAAAGEVQVPEIEDMPASNDEGGYRISRAASQPEIDLDFAEDTVKPIANSAPASDADAEADAPADQPAADADEKPILRRRASRHARQTEEED